MTLSDRFARFGDRVFDRLRHASAFALTDDGAIDGDFEALRGHTYAVLVTFRPSGEPVPSPVWFGVDAAGRVYVKTRHDAGKVRRLVRDTRVLLAPSNARGKPSGPAIRGTGRVLPEGDWPHAEETLAAAYGTGRRMSERVLGGPAHLAAYIEVVPGRSAPPDDAAQRA